jgi:signal peptidase I
VSKLARFLFWTAVGVGGTIGLARLVALRWWRVPSDDPVLEASIAPTLRGGDLVLLWRATPPRFGDLVVCPEPDAPDRVVVARLVGEQGDRVLIVESNVTLNGKQAQTERACEPFEVIDPNTGQEVKQRCDIEALEGQAHMRGSTAGQRLGPAPQEREVATGHVFLLSDNRQYPYDSRDFGTVERATCREAVVFRLVSKDGYFDQPNRFTFIQ